MGANGSGEEAGVGADEWLESATTTLGAVLAADYAMHVDRALLTSILDRRRSNLANALGLTPAQVEPMLDGGELRDIARMMDQARQAGAAVA